MVRRRNARLASPNSKTSIHLRDAFHYYISRSESRSLILLPEQKKKRERKNTRTEKIYVTTGWLLLLLLPLTPTNPPGGTGPERAAYFFR